MESIKTIAAVFCGVCVLSGGFQLLSGGALEKSAGYILSLIMLVCIIGALSKADFDFEIKESSAAVSTAGALELSEYQAEYISRKVLDEKGIKYKKITADATKTEDGSIIINNITIKGADPSDKAIELLLATGLTETVKTE